MLARSVVLTTTIAGLAGCGSISSTLGLERHVPDESQVVVRPTLTLPPDYDLMPPGTPSAVSAEHEAGSSTASAGEAPKKEERGFFGSLLHGDFFGNDVDATTAAAKPAADTATAPNVEGTPQAPATPPPGTTPPVAGSASPAADAPPPANASSPAAKPEERGFFGKLFHGEMF
ncbi:MAG: hypothetical protein JWM91_4143 [Rhodospirillales bacterium]|nr:hypothetical protein [Rhodospirillales bacterium]